MSEIIISVICDKCGWELTARQGIRSVKIVPCEHCMGKQYYEGYNEGKEAADNDKPN